MPLKLSPRIPGRGYWKGTEPVLFQTALSSGAADEHQRNQDMKALFSQMNGAWKGNRPGKTISATERLSVEGLAECYSDPYSIPVGCAGESMEPVYLELANRGRAVFCGEERTETAAYLRAMVRVASRSFPDMRIICIDASDGDMEPVREACTDYFRTSDNERAMAVLTDLWNTREKDVLPIEMRPARAFVFVHDVCRLLRTAEEDTFKPLLRLVNNNNSRSSGTVVIATGTRQALAQDSKEYQLVMKLLLWKDGVVLSGVPRDYRDDLEFPFDYTSADFGRALTADYGVRCQAESRSAKIKLLKGE